MAAIRAAVSGERAWAPPSSIDAECVVGVRFPDSGRVYYFRPHRDGLDVGDWVVVPTARGQEAARVVIAPHQVRRALPRRELAREWASELACRVELRQVGPRDEVHLLGGLGRCGRLVRSHSYEDERYRQIKAVMPKLGQTVETPGGTGQVVSMHMKNQLVTVRLDEDNIDATFRTDELTRGARGRRHPEA